MALLKNLTNSKVKMYLIDEEEDDQRKLNAKDRDKKEREYFEQQKKQREEARKLAMERAQKLKAEREAQEKAAREAREKAAREQAAKEAARKKAAETQASKTTAQRDEEEKAFYESSIKAAHQREKKAIGQYTDTGKYQTETKTKVSDYVNEREKLKSNVSAMRENTKNPYKSQPIYENRGKYSLSLFSDEEVQENTGNSIYATPHIFQGNYSGDNYNISSMYYGVEEDNEVGDHTTIGYNGCELISTVMAIAGLGGYDDDNYYEHVLEARDYALGDNDSGKIYKSDGGTSISFAQDFAKENGLTSYGTNSIDEAKYALENGGVLVVNVEKGNDEMFTAGSGHYITVTGINEDGTWQVNNPNRKGYDAYMEGEDSFTQQEIEDHLRSITTRNNIVVIREEPLTFEDSVRIFRNQEPFVKEIP